MIDGVGKGGTGRIDIARQDRNAAVNTPRSHGPRAADGPVKSAVLELVSGGAPVDSAKVETIRTAIAEGRYPIDADRIAKRMLDFDLPGRG
jgi:negative regulator of flagellin synthesis FlgM